MIFDFGKPLFWHLGYLKVGAGQGEAQAAAVAVLCHFAPMATSGPTTAESTLPIRVRFGSKPRYPFICGSSAFHIESNNDVTKVERMFAWDEEPAINGIKAVVVVNDAGFAENGEML